MRSLLRSPLTAVLAGLLALSPVGQAAADGTVLPVWNSDNGKVEALLLLEPTNAPGQRWQLGRASLDATFGLDHDDSLGLLCSNAPAGTALSALASNCMLATLDGGSRQASAGAAISRPGGRLGISAGTSRNSNLPAWLSATPRGNARGEQTNLTVIGQRNIGREGYISLGGSYARARLVPMADASPTQISQWDSKSLSVGGGYGPFSANIIGRVIDVPGRSSHWEGLGLGLTWRTPWSGQLTVGADNVITRGKNPFAPRNGTDDEGTVPYVRYQQDL
jgi:hypothetical protein